MEAGIFVLLFAIFSPFVSEANILRREKRQSLWNKNSRWSPPSFRVTTPMPFTTTSSFMFNTAGPNRGSMWGPPPPKMNGPGPGHSPMGMPMMPFLSKNKAPVAPTAPPPQTNKASSGDWRAGGGAAVAVLTGKTDSNLGASVPLQFLQGLSLMMQTRLKKLWVDPIYRHQAELAGDAYTFNPAPPEDGYPGGRCPPGITKTHCKYNPCPRCRNPNIKCWTNMCGGCTAEMYQFGQALNDCETI